MNTMKLIAPFKREIWEHQGAFFGVFTVLGALLVVLTIVGMVQLNDPSMVHINIEADDFEFSSKDMDGENFNVIGMLEMGLQSMVVTLLHLFVFISTWVTFFYLLDCLYTDRKDRSILFWKSLPVSETQSVLTKFATGIFVVPAIAVAIGLIASILLGFLVSIWVPMLTDISFFDVWGELNYVKGLIVTIAFTLVSGIWIAPFCAWLMLASSFTKRAPFLWAVAPPALVIIAEKILYGKSILLSVLGAYMPDPVAFETYDDSMTIENMLALTKSFLIGPELIIGVFVAAVLLVASIWLRNRRYEI